MPTYIQSAGFILAAALSALLTCLCIPLARRLRLMDRPGNRKTHTHAVAYLGGVALFAALTLALFASLLYGGLPVPVGSGLFACLAAALAASALGLADDIRDLPARLKFFLQAGIALSFSFFAFSFEVIHLPGLKPFDLGLFSLPITAFFIMAVANGMNMIDGSDGLCASSAAASLALCSVVACIHNQPQLCLLALSSCGACLGFLTYNRAPARIYLGDAGSQGLGFLVATLLVALGQPMAQVSPFQPFHYQALLMLLIAGFPALEVTLSVMRRGLQGRSLFRGDQGHLHHRLQKLGLGPAWISRFAVAFTLLSGSVAIAFLLSEKGVAVVLTVILVGLLGLSLSQLGYARFLQRRWLDERRPHFAVARHFVAMQSAKLLLARSMEESLALVTQACRELGVEKFRIRLHDPVSKRQVWTWFWVLEIDSYHFGGTVEHLRLRGLGSATWRVVPPSIEPELEMECRVLIWEFMRKALERIHDQHRGAIPGEADMASLHPDLSAPSITWLKGRTVWAG